MPALYPCRSKPNDLASRILPAPLRAFSCILRDRTFSFCAHQAVQETFAAQAARPATFVEKAQEKAQDAQERVQQVAQEAQSAAQQEAENQGLTQQ